MRIDIGIADAELVVGVVVARGVKVGASAPELGRRVEALVGRRAGEEFPPAGVKEGVRDMLRKGGFRPAGRNKPASEYLAQAAREGRFPRINNLVDVNNLLSLESGLPISMLDLEAVGEQVEIRYGREGEKYVFNAGGQEIDLKGLVCVCRVEGGESRPLGNPIKDSMAGKIKEHTRGVIGVIYGSVGVVDEKGMGGYVGEFGKLLREFGGAGEVEEWVGRDGKCRMMNEEG